MDPKTNETAMSRRAVLCASGATALSALVAGFAGCAGTTSPRQTASAEPPRAHITVLYDAFGKASAMQKDWGYAALIEYGGKRILFDTGNNPEILAQNARAKGIDLSKLDFVVMSHRHGDHMGGMAYLLNVNPKVKIYAPKEGFGVYGGDLPSTFYRKDSSLPPEQRYYDGAPPAVMRRHGGAPCRAGTMRRPSWRVRASCWPAGRPPRGNCRRTTCSIAWSARAS